MRGPEHELAVQALVLVRLFEDQGYQLLLVQPQEVVPRISFGEIGGIIVVGAAFIGLVGP